MRHSESSFTASNNVQLFCHSWLPEQKIKANLIFVHGLADHSSRFGNLVEYMIPRGFAVYGYDQRGHGRSAGKRGYVGSFRENIADLKEFRASIPESKIPVFILGHSMGGLVALACAAENPNLADGLVVTSPLLKPGGSVSEGRIKMARFIARLLPKMGISVLDSGGVSRDPAVVKAYNSDPLIYHGKLHARTGAELMAEMFDRLPPKLGEIKQPVLMMLGTDDRLANPEGGRAAFERLGSKDRTLRFYPHLYHELMNEPEHAQVLEDMYVWLARRI